MTIIYYKHIRKHQYPCECFLQTELILKRSAGNENGGKQSSFAHQRDTITNSSLGHIQFLLPTFDEKQFFVRDQTESEFIF